MFQRIPIAFTRANYTMNRCMPLQDIAAISNVAGRLERNFALLYERLRSFSGINRAWIVLTSSVIAAGVPLPGPSSSSQHLVEKPSRSQLPVADPARGVVQPVELPGSERRLWKTRIAMWYVAV